MKIIEKAALTVVGIPVHAAWTELWTEMPRAWRVLIARHAEIEGRVSARFLDVSLEKRGERYSQLIGAEVASVGVLPSSMISVEIPAQRYIHHQHRGPTPGIAASFGAIYDWARAHGHAADDFKLDDGYTAVGDELVHDLFVRSPRG